MRTNASADDDLRYISNARYLIPAKGGFGKIARLMARNAVIVNLTCVNSFMPSGFDDSRNYSQYRM
jgi:hypothetical protein